MVTRGIRQIIAGLLFIGHGANDLTTSCHQPFQESHSGGQITQWCWPTQVRETCWHMGTTRVWPCRHSHHHTGESKASFPQHHDVVLMEQVRAMPLMFNHQKNGVCNKTVGNGHSGHLHRWLSCLLVPHHHPSCSRAPPRWCQGT